MITSLVQSRSFTSSYTHGVTRPFTTTMYAYSSTDAGASTAAAYVDGNLINNTEMVNYVKQSTLESDTSLSSDPFGTNSHSDSGAYRDSVSNYSSRISTHSDLWTSESDPEILTSSIQPKTHSEFTSDSIHLYAGYSICDVMSRCGIRSITPSSSHTARIIMSSINALAMMKMCSHAILLKNSGSTILKYNTCCDERISLTCHTRRLLSASIRSSSVTHVDLFQYSSLLGSTEMSGSLLTSDVQLFAHPHVYIGGLEFYKSHFIKSFEYVPGGYESNMVLGIADLIFSKNPDLSSHNIQSKVPTLAYADCILLSNLLSNTNLNVFRSETERPIKEADIASIIHTNNTIMTWNGDTGFRSTLNQFKFQKCSTDVTWSNVSSLRYPNAMVLNESYDINNIYYAHVYSLTLSSDVNTQTMQFCESEYTMVTNYEEVLNASDNYKWLSLVMFGRTFEAGDVKLAVYQIRYAEEDPSWTFLKQNFPSLQVAVLDDSDRSFQTIEIENSSFNSNDYMEICNMSKDLVVVDSIDAYNNEKDSDNIPFLSVSAARVISDSSSNVGLEKLTQGVNSPVKINTNEIILYDSSINARTTTLKFEAVKMVSDIPRKFERITAAASFIGERVDRRSEHSHAHLSFKSSSHLEAFSLNSSGVRQIRADNGEVEEEMKPKFVIGTEIVKSAIAKQSYGKQFLSSKDIRNIIRNIPVIEASANQFKDRYILAICLPTCTGKTTMAKKFPEYLVDIDDLINKSRFRNMMKTNRAELFSESNRDRINDYLDIECTIITKIVNEAILSGELKSKVLLLHSPTQVRNIPQIVVAGCLKLSPGNWDINISKRRALAEDVERFDRNIQLAKLGSKNYIEMSQSLLQLVVVLISHKFNK